MTFLAPSRLWLLAAVALLAGAYVLLQHRRRHYAVRFTNVELLASLAPRRPGWRRHLPAGALALALVALVLGLARPAWEERVPREGGTVVLVLDTSASMEATDVSPSRLEAATRAARTFVEDLPPALEVGLVTFDATTRVVAPPTTRHEIVAEALARLTTGPGTAAGEAVHAALQTLAPGGSAPGAPAPVEPIKGAAIVLLSDGVTTVGRPVEVAATDAAALGVPVSTIAFGTPDGVVTVLGQRVAVPADPDTMASVAEITGGRFFEAASAEQLSSVYADIGRRVGYEVEWREIGMTFVTVGVLLLMAAVAASLLWSARIV